MRNATSSKSNLRNEKKSKLLSPFHEVIDFQVSSSLRVVGRFGLLSPFRKVMNLRLLSHPYVKKMTWPLYFKKYEDLRLKVIIHVVLEKFWVFLRGCPPNSETRPTCLTRLNPTRQLPEPITPAVSGGSLPSKSDTFELVGRFPPLKLESPNPIIKSKKIGDIWRFSNENLQKPAIFEVFQRRFTWNPLDLTRSPPDLARYHRIWWDLRQIWWRSRQIWQDLNKPSEDLLDLTKI